MIGLNDTNVKKGGREFERSVKVLREVVFRLLEPGQTSTQESHAFIPFYTLVHDLCTRGGWSIQLYSRLHDMLYTHARACALLLHEDAGACGGTISKSSFSIDGSDVQNRRQRLATVLNNMGMGSAKSEEGKVRLYLVFWRAFHNGMGKISSLFAYLDRRWQKPIYYRTLCASSELFVPANLGPRPMATLLVGLMAWRDEVLHVVGTLLAREMLECIRDGRLKRGWRLPDSQGAKVTSRQLEYDEIAEVVKSLVDVGDCNGDCEEQCDPEDESGLSRQEVYRAVFERKYIDETIKFYQHEAVLMLEQMSPVEYMRAVHDDILITELKVAESYIDQSTRKSLHEALERALVKNHIDMLVAQAPDLIRGQSTDDLRRLHSLLSSVDEQLRIIRDQLRDQVADAGAQALDQFAVTTDGSNFAPARDKENSTAFVEADSSSAANFSDVETAERFVSAVWSVYSQFRALVEEAFEDAKPFTLALDQGCSRFINSVKSASAHLAVYSNALLSSTDDAMKINERDLEEELDRLTRLFRYINDKDLFHTLLATALAKRLVTGMSVSREAELSMLSRIESTCGTESTVRLRKMLQDIDMSAEHSDLFREAVLRRTSDLCGIDFSVLVLSARCWPINSELSSNERIPMQRRTSEWNPNSSSPQLYTALRQPLDCLIALFTQHYTTRRSGRRLEWQHSLSRVQLRACVGKRLFEMETSYHQAQLLLQLNDAVHVRADRAMGEDAEELVVCGLLVRHPLNTGGSILRVNDSFSPQHDVLQFSQQLLWQNEAAREVEKAHSKLGKDRGLEIQAVLVRRMKVAGQLEHSKLIELTMHTISQRFCPAVVDIKRQIDRLIEMDYLVRTGNDKNEYRYVA